MTREYLINFLIEEGCHSDDEGSNGVSELWCNCINGETCYVPHEPILKLTTYCHIFYELRVGPPPEYDSDYAVYSSFREMARKEHNKAANI
jgi:hypothetical protein